MTDVPVTTHLELDPATSQKIQRNLDAWLGRDTDLFFMPGAERGAEMEYARDELVSAIVDPRIGNAVVALIVEHDEDPDRAPSSDLYRYMNLAVNVGGAIAVAADRNVEAAREFTMFVRTQAEREADRVDQYVFTEMSLLMHYFDSLQEKGENGYLSPHQELDSYVSESLDKLHDAQKAALQALKDQYEEAETALKQVVVAKNQFTPRSHRPRTYERSLFKRMTGPVRGFIKYIETYRTNRRIAQESTKARADTHRLQEWNNEIIDLRHMLEHNNFDTDAGTELAQLQHDLSLVEIIHSTPDPLITEFEASGQNLTSVGKPATELTQDVARLSILTSGRDHHELAELYESKQITSTPGRHYIAALHDSCLLEVYLDNPDELARHVSSGAFLTDRGRWCANQAVTLANRTL